MYNESLQMRMEEIAAVMSLSGKKTLVGFQEDKQISQQKLWDACCGLMRDGMLTQIDGKFRLRRDVMAIMQPICQARSVLALTPASDLFSQLMIYAADTATVVKKTPFGYQSLTSATCKELPELLSNHLQLKDPEIETTQEDVPPEVTVTEDSSHEELLSGAQFLLERLDPETGGCTCWLRMVQQGVLSWLQWPEKGKIESIPYTAQTLQERIKALLS